MTNECMAGTYFVGCLAAIAIAAIAVPIVGLSGGLSLQAASITSLVSSFFNPVGGAACLVVSILGLTGNTTVTVVSGVTLGSTLLSLMICSSSASPR
ncbi:MAG: hypothetical protein S4CHLAM2_05520 [Chlamydiales bacterium]|nr:hypothetical protein [Chlamydiales bacterium]